MLCQAVCTSSGGHNLDKFWTGRRWDLLFVCQFQIVNVFTASLLCTLPNFEKWQPPTLPEVTWGSLCCDVKVWCRAVDVHMARAHFVCVYAKCWGGSECEHLDHGFMVMWRHVVWKSFSGVSEKPATCNRAKKLLIERVNFCVGVF